MGKLKEGAAPAAPLTETVHPSGIEINYFVEPKRKYEIKVTDSEWIEVPSVTTVLDTLEKGGLSWWGMRVGLQGVTQLFNMGVLFPVEIMVGNRAQRVLGLRDASGQVVTAGLENVEELLKKNKLTTNDVKEDAGDRGQSAHDALEIWANSGDMPQPAMFAPQEQPYIMALVKALTDLGAEPLAWEVVVGSIEHGFAGRYDIRFRLHEERRVVVHHTPVLGPQFAIIPPGIYLGDLKSSKSVYVTHAKQLAAYELGSIECGLGATDARIVIHVDKDGKYRIVRTDEWATPHDFLTTLAEYNSLAGMKRRKPPGAVS